MDEVLLTRIEAKAHRMYQWAEEHNAGGLAEIDILAEEFIPDLIAAIRRLKRENHLLSLSRGIPSAVGRDCHEGH